MSNENAERIGPDWKSITEAAQEAVATAHAALDRFARAWEHATGSQTSNENADDVIETGEVSDGYHTFNELYEYRMLYNAHAARGWREAGIPVVKSWRHSDGEPCFGGGWFIVTATLPTGQVSNHYPADDWGLFAVPEVECAPVWDGHTPAEAADRLRTALLEGADG